MSKYVRLSLAILLALLLIALLLTRETRTREDARRIVCLSNMRAIINALNLYGETLDLDASDILSQLIRHGYLPENAAKCPGGDFPYQLNRSVLRVPLSQQPAPTRQVVIIEDPRNHGGNGGGVGYADGHVEYLPAAEVERLAVDSK